MSRFDLFWSVHQALQAEAFAVAVGLARADFRTDATAAAARRDESAGDWRAACVAARECLAVFHLHAECEEACVLPVIARLGSFQAADLRTDHTRLEGFESELGRLLDVLLDETNGLEPEPRALVGRRLAERWRHYVVLQLAHMEREETNGNRLLWAHCTDEELHAIEAAIVARVPDERRPGILRMFLVSQSARDQVTMLRGVMARVPASAWDRATAPARRALGESTWQRLVAEARS